LPEQGISDATFYNWRAKYGGLDVSEAQRLRQMEDENRRLKALVADLSLDKDAVLERRGQAVNVKRVYRMYVEQGLAVRRRGRKRLVREQQCEPGVGDGLHRGWTGERPDDPHPQRGGCVHARVPGAGG
jgi:hypothetical protein